ncbi:efflux RND transporter permease subunit [Pelagicoccus mobilis]|uniref:Efflux RND transporter permease subunit n=1 Tax=Pelagicoccus mobilis TaxID=415221 RepID=A0A934S0Z9_9BACT|nr:efflux RND transporter permease subunit [Pelagicoccus mobilis]MBK1879928.1 efflux RND transporter permease subunit [Pelagicoccus mobilis]
MLTRLINFSLNNRLLIVAAALAVLGMGIQTARQLPVEVLPDLTKPTVTILTEAPGLAPEEVETLVTVPLESALMGVSGVTRLRTTSDVALSLAYVEFDWGTDIYLARQFVQERLQVARESLPEGIQPYMTPVASLMGEIMLVGVRSTDQSIEPRDVRTLADWTVARRLQSIPGIAEVLAMGGGIKQVQVQPDPHHMLALDVSFEELRAATAQAAQNTTGGFLTNAPQEIMVRHLAMTTDLDALGSTVIKVVDDRPIRIDDVATIKWDIEPMRGDAAVNGTPGVILSVTKSPGFDTLDLTEKVEQALADLQTTVPKSIELVPLFRQADFINNAVGNLQEALKDGAIMVSIILFLFLLNVRTTLITLTAIPLSFAIAILVFRWFGISINSMTLGGLAVAIGMVVDDAIVDVENVFRRLKENAVSKSQRPKLEVIASASAEVRNSILYATLFIILVFLPLLGLSGVEGRLFAPIAVATIVSMLASFLVSLTIIPVLASFLLRSKAENTKTSTDPWLVRFMKTGFRHTWLKLALDRPFIVLTFASFLFAGALSLYPRMGKDFLPSFNEETLLIALTAAPGTSLQQTNQISDVVEDLILDIPEIRAVGRRVGRAERGDHVVPVSTVEFDIDFHKELEGARPRSEVVEEIRQRVRGLPGTFAAISGPLADRIGHMLSGVSAKVAIKVYGEDLEEIRRIGTRIQTIARSIPGLDEARIEQQAPIPQLRIEVDRDRALAYGITPGSLNDQLAALMGGDAVGELYEGPRAIDLVLRLPDEWRDNPKRLEQLYVDTANGGRVPLSYVANIREARGPNIILRENTQRRFVVSINPTARDLSGLVTRLRERVNTELTLPEGVFLSFEGEFKAQEEATQRIALLSLLSLSIMAALLFSYFKTSVFTIQVLFDIPLALIGGLVLTWLMLNNISIATLVGFIAVTGVAARNSVMMISHYLHLMRHEGEGFTREMVERGTLERLVPVLMTALSAGIALIPLLLAADQPGKEILHPVAVVIVGGLVTSTFLGLGVTPAAFYAFGSKAAKKALAQDSAASN